MWWQGREVSIIAGSDTSAAHGTGKTPTALVNLMGYASKQMIYEVYGKYTEGLEQDRLAIFRYYGKDFNAPDKRKAPAACENYCESRG